MEMVQPRVGDACAVYVDGWHRAEIANVETDKVSERHMSTWTPATMLHLSRLGSQGEILQP